MLHQDDECSIEEDSIFSIIISTDNHVGYQEEDPIRGNDSFYAFNEVLDVATRRKADIVLLGGDLFHYQNPTRKTIVKTSKILNRWVCGERDEPIKFETKNF